VSIMHGITVMYFHYPEFLTDYSAFAVLRSKQMSPLEYDRPGVRHVSTALPTGAIRIRPTAARCPSNGFAARIEVPQLTPNWEFLLAPL
jgi:hypothetical protein